jgi:Ca2+-transporting ATPase
LNKITPLTIFFYIFNFVLAALCILAEKLGGFVELDNSSVSNRIRASFHVNDWRSRFIRTATLEFNRDRKSMSVLVMPSDGKKGASNRLLVKGAPNLLLKRCTHIKDRDGKVVKLTGELRRSIEDKISDLSMRPLRCLALAVKEPEHLDRSLKAYTPHVGEENEDAARHHPLLRDPSKYVDVESGLTLVGALFYFFQTTNSDLRFLTIPLL